MPSQTKENYLKAIYFLHQKNKDISVTELSKQMSVSTPTANNMVKKMQAIGWLEYRKYKPLKLTSKGLKAAALIVRKHRLAEMFLSRIMGFGWEEVHDIAEEMEHLQSEKFFDRMNELLGYPTVDPHGSPIPDKSGKAVKKNYHRLSEVAQGQKVRLCAVTDSSKELLSYLNRKKIRLGTEIEVQKVESYDNSVTVSYDGQHSVTLTDKVSEHLLIEQVES